MDKVVRFWVECEIPSRPGFITADRQELIGAILGEWEEYGDVMRGLDRRGRLCWKATPQLRERLADQERDARDDLRNI